MSGFRWTQKTSAAALGLAEGKTVQEVAADAQMAERTIYRWKADCEFSAEVDRLSLMVGIANRAHRLRIAQRVVNQRTNMQTVFSEKDLLDWLKFAQSETQGLKLDLSQLAAVLGGENASNEDDKTKTEDDWELRTPEHAG